MIKKIEHLGIAVEDIDASIALFEKLLQEKCYKIEVVQSELVKTAFLQVGESKIELLQAVESNSVIDKFLKKNGQGFHHIAFEVDNIDKELDRLKKSGFELIHKSPKNGADNKLIAFLHPKSTNGLLVEICQENK